MNFLQDMLTTISERSRALIDRSPRRIGFNGRLDANAASPSQIANACRTLLSSRGEASGAALAKEILDLYETLPKAGKAEFFRLLATDFGPDRERLGAAWSAYERTPDVESLRVFLRLSEPPRQELFRRLNLAPAGTSRLVAMREDVFPAMADEPDLAVIDDDLSHLLRSWFNRGFLVLRRITWSTPADVLERIIRYEAVHEISGWDDLQRRLAPSDRRCYAFFHPSLVDDPLIFVEVALMRQIPASVQEILIEDRPVLKAEDANTAVFYSISNCQAGLRGISFGNFLIKQVVEDLSRDLPGLKNFVTLSPAPGFGQWVRKVAVDPAGFRVSEQDAEILRMLDAPDWSADESSLARLRPILIGLASSYYLDAKNAAGRPLDSVARFHLGNGARLERLNWPGDLSPKGLSEGAGLMVNYLYDLASIETNHEAFANNDAVVASAAVMRQRREFESRRSAEVRHV